MEVEIGRGKKARRAYGFDDIAIVPSRRTRDPDDVDITWKLGDYRFDLPLMARPWTASCRPRRPASSASSAAWRS
jgi:IMP dehydrogenase